MSVREGCCGDPGEARRLTAEAEARADAVARVQSAVESGHVAIGERGRLALIRTIDTVARLCARARIMLGGDS